MPRNPCGKRGIFLIIFLYTVLDTTHPYNPTQCLLEQTEPNQPIT